MIRESTVRETATNGKFFRTFRYWLMMSSPPVEDPERNAIPCPTPQNNPPISAIVKRLPESRVPLSPANTLKKGLKPLRRRMSRAAMINTWRTSESKENMANRLLTPFQPMMKSGMFKTAIKILFICG